MRPFHKREKGPPLPAAPYSTQKLLRDEGDNQRVQRERFDEGQSKKQ